MRFVK